MYMKFQIANHKIIEKNNLRNATYNTQKKYYAKKYELILIWKI